MRDGDMLEVSTPGIGGVMRVERSAEGYEAARLFLSIGTQMEANKQVCVDYLRREHDVQLVTPNDGWVDRENNIVNPPSYAAFVGDIRVGSIIALGSPTTDDKIAGSYQLFRVTEVLPAMFSRGRYRFEDYGQPRVTPPANLPAPKPPAVA